MAEITKLDTDQVIKYAFDEENRAQRVYVINDNSLGHNGHKEAVREIEYKEIKIPEIIKEKDVQVVYVDRPIIQEKIVVVEIEKPIFIEKENIKEIKVPHIVEKIKEVYIPQIKAEDNKEIPVFVKICMIAQIIATLGIPIIGYVLKH